MIHDLIEGKSTKGEGQGRPEQLTETLEPLFGLKQIQCHYLSPGFLQSLLTGFDFFFTHPILSPKSILHVAAGAISLKFKTELFCGQTFQQY